MSTTVGVCRLALMRCSLLLFLFPLEQLVAEAMGRARGGVLFIDEAYELGVGSYGREAQTKLLELLTADEYKTSTVVIMAGYEEDINEMLARNPGLKSRFTETLKFPDWSEDPCVDFFVHAAHKDSHTVQPQAIELLRSKFRVRFMAPDTMSCCLVVDE